MPGKSKALNNTNASQTLTDRIENIKASIRAKVEHPFRVKSVSSGIARCAAGSGQQHQPTDGDVCAVQLVDGAQANDGVTAGMSAIKPWERTGPNGP